MSIKSKSAYGKAPSPKGKLAKSLTRERGESLDVDKNEETDNNIKHP